MQIFYKNARGFTFTIEIEADDSIEQLAQAIQEKDPDTKNLSFEQFCKQIRIFFRDSQIPLDKNSLSKTLRDYKLEKESTVSRKIALGPAAGALEYDVLLKVAILGDSGVGKSLLTLRYTEDYYSENFIDTIGMNCRVKTQEIEGKTVKLALWDYNDRTLEERRGTTSSPIGSTVVIITYDITDKSSFIHAETYLQTFTKHYRIAPIILVGTKTDLSKNRCVSEDDVNKFIAEHQQYDISAIEVSSKDNINVQQLFELVCQKGIEQKEQANVVEQQRTLDQSKKVITPTVNFCSRYDKQFDGQPKIYNKLFVETLALITGKRSFFANTRAWINGNGHLFADTKALFSGQRGFFANTRAALKAESSEYDENTYK